MAVATRPCPTLRSGRSSIGRLRRIAHQRPPDADTFLADIERVLA
jgi:hypothetical protein